MHNLSFCIQYGDQKPQSYALKYEITNTEYCCVNGIFTLDFNQYRPTSHIEFNLEFLIQTSRVYQEFQFMFTSLHLPECGIFFDVQTLCLFFFILDAKT